LFVTGNSLCDIRSDMQLHISCSICFHSENIQGIFREHSGNIQGTFREDSGNFKGDVAEAHPTLVHSLRSNAWLCNLQIKHQLVQKAIQNQT
jgi:hypothetical protein